MPIIQDVGGFAINDPCPNCRDSGLKPVLKDLILPSSSRTSVIRRNVIANLFCGQCNKDFEAIDVDVTTDELLAKQVESFQRKGRKPKRCPKCRKRVKDKGACIPSWMERKRIADGRGYAPKSEYERKFDFCRSYYIVTWVVPAPCEPSSTKRFLLGKRR